MNIQTHPRRWYFVFASLGFSLILGFASFLIVNEVQAGPFWRLWRDKKCDSCQHGEGDIGGSWHWVRSPDEEKRVVAGLYNRYCIRCHGVDGRGIWDIPGVPDFTNVRWQTSRSDQDLARIVIEGRGAVMPPFRGTLSLEEAYAVGRYLRTFVPGTELSRPDFSALEKTLPEKIELPKAK